ncbi:MAG: hypothetical protein ACHWZW_10035 [Spirulina sp.]
MTLSVGTIETYVPGSTEFYETQYGNLGTDERESLSLSDSNLWLVDSTALKQSSTDDLSLLALYSASPTTDTEGYLAPMASTTMASTTGNVTIYGSTPTADSVLYTNSSALQLSDGSPLLEVQGGTQSSATLISNSGGGLSPTTLTNFGGTSGTSTTTSGTGSTGSFTGGGTDDPSITDGGDGVGTGDGGGSGTPTTGGLDGTPDIPGEVKPVPFELHTSLGLLTLGAIVIVRRSGWWRRRRPVAQP